MDVRREIELKLRGNLLRDWCRQLAKSNEAVEFQDAWCSGHHTMRLSTETIDRLFDHRRSSDDCWGLGRVAFYEVSNSTESISISLAVSRRGLSGMHQARLEALAKSLAEDGFDTSVKTSDPMLIATWNIPLDGFANGNVGDSLDDIWQSDITFFEQGLEAWIAGRQNTMWRIPENERFVVSPGDVDDTLFVEGAQITILTDRFERSNAARRRCIATHGTACAICGIDFGTLYGARFAGKIEVHHKKPLSEIREDYVVDPVNDLVPVCPNCHMVLHSKPGNEPYTVEEVRLMLKPRKPEGEFNGEAD